MAEFQEVMRQYKRLCKEFRSGLHSKYCVECPVSSVRNGKDATCTEVMRSEPEWFEKSVMDWAAANPEPRYPSWKEWHETNFPDAKHDICPNFFMSKKPLGTCAISCAKCANTPYPPTLPRSWASSRLEVPGMSKPQDELREWYQQMHDAKTIDLPQIEAIEDPVERALRHKLWQDRIERIEMQIERILKEM